MTNMINLCERLRMFEVGSSHHYDDVMAAADEIERLQQLQALTVKQPWNAPSGWRGLSPWFKVGDRVLPLSALHRWYPIHTVTEITSRGFKYSHDRFSLGARIGWTEGGETFDPSAYEYAAVEPSSKP
jgi:hypothetical protein